MARSKLRLDRPADIVSQGSTDGITSLSQLVNMLNRERMEKYTSGLSNLQGMLNLFGPGYGKGMEKTAMAGVEEDLISRGLGKTTKPVAMSVGMKADIEGMRLNKLAESLIAMSQYTQQSAPTPALVSSVAGSANVAFREPGRLSPYMQAYDAPYTSRTKGGGRTGYSGLIPAGFSGLRK